MDQYEHSKFLAGVPRVVHVSVRHTHSMKLELSEDDMERLNEGRDTVSYTDDKEVVIKMIPPKQHGLDHAYVMTPHVVTEMPENIHSMDLPDEEKSQGFHRKAAEVECLCGETWHGDGAWKKFKDHLDDV